MSREDFEDWLIVVMSLVACSALLALAGAGVL
jgi:uncharacterized membrane protein YjjP (DUF1212 family)